MRSSAREIRSRRRTKGPRAVRRRSVTFFVVFFFFYRPIPRVSVRAEKDVLARRSRQESELLFMTEQYRVAPATLPGLRKRR